MVFHYTLEQVRWEVPPSGNAEPRASYHQHQYEVDNLAKDDGYFEFKEALDPLRSFMAFSEDLPVEAKQNHCCLAFGFYDSEGSFISAGDILPTTANGESDVFNPVHEETD